MYNVYYYYIKIMVSDEWVTTFEKEDAFFKDFYKENIYYSKVHTLYVNCQQELDLVKEETFLFSKPNIITKDEINDILKGKSVHSGKSYKLGNVMKYNIKINPETVISCSLPDYDTYLEEVPHIETIHFDKTISLFQDLTDLFFIFYEKGQKVKISRKLSIKSANKKTKRNLF